MRWWGWLSVALMSPIVLALPVAAIVAVQPDQVGPPWVILNDRCSRVEEPNGAAAGTPIPIAGLRLGAPVRRGAVSFTTGGSGTANAFEMQRRKAAGLPYEPMPFDVTGSTPPVVFSATGAVARGGYMYQRLVLKNPLPGQMASGLIFARTTSATHGRIASLHLAIRQEPKARPRLRVTTGVLLGGSCRNVRTLDVYAPDMTAKAVRRLFSNSTCHWYALQRCSRPDRPRGRVLFVQRQLDLPYIHRWVDYGALAK